MRRSLLAILPAAGLALAAAPAFAQEYNENYPSGGGVHTPGTTWTAAPSAAGASAFAGPLGAPVALLEAPFSALGAGMATPAGHPRCWVIRDWQGPRYTSVCGP